MTTSTNNRVVAVFGATGYTGQYVVAELLKRGIKPIAIARNEIALTDVYGDNAQVTRRAATVEDARKLDEALAGAQVVINCTGPAAFTAEPLAKAALRAGIHYVDVSAEQASVNALYEKYDREAQERGIVIVPALAYFGGLSDMMATVLMKDWAHADSIDVMVGFDSWNPTVGTRNTLAQILSDPNPRTVVRDGKVTAFDESGAQSIYKFDAPIGEMSMTECPLTEIPVIARHLKAERVSSHITSVALRNAFDPNTPPPQKTAETGRSAQRFMFDVLVKRGTETRRATAQGSDGYATTAPMVCEAAERLIAGNFKGTGAKAPGDVFDAEDFLKALGDEVKFKVTAATV